MTLTYDSNQLSAILILKKEEALLKGSMVNEFGVNFVEFTVKNGKAKIVRLNPMFKKPFLKRVLRRSFERLADCLEREEEASLQLTHQKSPLTINLFPL